MTTIQQIQQFLEEDGLNYEPGNGDFLFIGFRDIGNYTNKDGAALLKVFVGIDENGDYIQIVAPGLYKLHDCPYKAKVHELLNLIGSNFKFLRWDTVKNGCINPIIDLPLDDSNLSKAQFKRCLGTLLEFVDSYNEKILYTMETGEINL